MLALLAAATLKLCLPSNTTVPYSTACPAGTTSVKKICPSGVTVSYSIPCPSTPPPPPAPASGMALALQACPAINRPESIVPGQTYAAVGFAGWSTPGNPPPPAGTKDVVILSDATHLGDGYFALYVPATCVQLRAP